MEITGQKVKDAEAVLRAEYWQAVRNYAQQFIDESEEIEDKYDYLHQLVDGSEWIIYTHRNFKVLMFSENDDIYIEDFGTQGLLQNARINWAALAFSAFERDILDQLKVMGYKWE